MKDQLTPAMYANYVKMAIDAGETNLFILVEGNSDLLVYKQFFGNNCTFVDCKGKDNVIIALKDIECYCYYGVICIVDRDFLDCGEEIGYSSNNIFFTDTHDLECEILRSHAFDRFLDTYGSKNKVNKLELSLRELILHCGVFIGYLRYFSLSHSLNLDFNLITFRKYIDKRTLNLDKVKLINFLLINSGKDNETRRQLNSINRKDLLESVEVFIKKNPQDPWQICCGHDLIKILAVGMTRMFGDLKISDTDFDGIEGKRVEKDLELAYSMIDFVKTNLYLKLRDYQNSREEKYLIGFESAS